MIIHKELSGDYIHNPHKIIQVDILNKEYRLEGGLVAHFSEEDDYELVEQNPAWSEEDEEMVDNIFKAIQHLLKENDSWGFLEDCLDWLKSLKNRVQPHWKPTEGQMQALEFVVQYHAFASQDTREKIVALFNDLKKL